MSNRIFNFIMSTNFADTNAISKDETRKKYFRADSIIFLTIVSPALRYELDTGHEALQLTAVEQLRRREVLPESLAGTV